MSNKALLCLALACLASAPAHAQQIPIPRGDVDRASREIIGGKNSRGTPEEQHTRCFKEIQERYDRVKAGWELLSDPERKVCIDGAGYFSHDTYRVLAECVERVIFKRRQVEDRYRSSDAPVGVTNKEFRF